VANASVSGFRQRPLNILSLSCVYPNARDPGLGLFVRARLQRVAESLRIKVIAPVPRFDYAKLHQARVAAPSSRMDGEIEVFHPEWLYPPGGHAANAVLLFLQLLPLVRRIRKEFRFDLIDAHFAFPDGIAACLLARHFRVPFTVTLRGNETMHAAYAMRGRLIAWALKQASRVIGVSSKLREFAISLGVDEAKVRVIPNGIDATVFRPRGRGIREECHLSDADNIVLSAGTLIERKGHHRVVRAVAALRRGGIDAKLLIAGGPGREGRFESEIQKEVESSGLESSVQFLGEVRAERLAELMSAADVFCLASSRMAQRGQRSPCVRRSRGGYRGRRRAGFDSLGGLRIRRSARRRKCS